MKKLLKKIGLIFMIFFIGIIGLALIDGSNDEELKINQEILEEDEESKTNQKVSELESFLIEHEFNVENTMAIMKEYLPTEDYENITQIEEEGTAGAELWCNNKLSYYLIFYSNEHPETPGELMSIDTAEEDYNDRTRLFQAYETEVENTESLDIEKDKLYKILDTLCETNFTTNNVKYEIEINDNNKMILITQYYDNSLSEELTHLIVTNDLSSWTSLIESMKYANNEFVNLISNFKTFKDYDVSFELYSKVDGEDIIFINVTNGLVLFDMVDALGIEY